VTESRCIYSWRAGLHGLAHAPETALDCIQAI
jgi:hypothetical protein